MSASLRRQLLAIREEHGSLTPVLLVDLARDPEHPLHSRFEWDDAIAGEKWRIEQAGQLLRVTYNPIPGKASDLRAFQAVRGEDSPTSEYVPTDEAFADPFTAELLLRQMKRDWQTFKRRYDSHAQFAAYVRAQIGETA